MGSDGDSERYISDYGNLLLEVSRRTEEQGSVFGYIVTDKSDGFICWSGSASDLATAQSDATLEAQIFLDPYLVASLLHPCGDAIRNQPHRFSALPNPEGSVDLRHNRYRGPLVASNPRRQTAEMRLMDQPPYELDHPRREAVLEAILNRSRTSDWNVLATHVRSNHVHVIIKGAAKPEFLMTQLKSAASRHLNRLAFDDPARKRWARHGSTRRLWDRQSVLRALAYVMDEQGEPMSAFEADRSRRSRL